MMARRMYSHETYIDVVAADLTIDPDFMRTTGGNQSTDEIQENDRGAYSTVE